LARLRAYFAELGLFEADVCALRPAPSVDAQIDPIEASPLPHTTGYLHTSPEYALKRLIAAGSGGVYFLGHVFRAGEQGRRHAPEFTMAEWYRLSIPFSQFIDEACEALFLFLPRRPVERLSYREAFQRYAAVNYSDDPPDALRRALRRSRIEGPAVESEERGALLHLLLSHAVEPQLGRGTLTVLTDYPPNEAALARTVEKQGETVAERFELYIDGVELANGYHELPDGVELRRRFVAANRERIALGKQPLPLDEPFLSVCTPDFPDCCGVSVGIDRLLMLRHHLSSIEEALPFAWSTQ
jgi:lysyl-tRNA synthetase class 2